MRKRPNQPKYHHTKRTLEEIGASANCSIPEAMRFTGFSRAIVLDKLDTNAWKWFFEGQRRRIVTASIIEYQERKVQERQAS